MTDTTSRQQRVLAAIAGFTSEHGYPPSYRQIGDLVGLSSTSSVSHVIDRLVAKGFLRRGVNSPRLLTLVAPDPFDPARYDLVTDDLDQVRLYCQRCETVGTVVENLYQAIAFSTAHDPTCKPTTGGTP